MQTPYHHLHTHKKLHKKPSTEENKAASYMDIVIYIFGTIGALIFIPQMITVWTQRDITGVSMISWAGMFVGSMFWIFYGLSHKAKPVIYANILAAGIQFLVIVGILAHSASILGKM